jgi:L-fucose mutarotase
VIHLNLQRGLVTVDQAAAAVLSLVEVERIQVIAPDDHVPTAHAELQAVMPGVLEPLSRSRFYQEALHPTVSVAIATGDVRLWACLLLTIGVSHVT